jgi:predicted kinase
MTHPQIHILRGLPGSGKSTWVTNGVRSGELSGIAVVCSADDFRFDDEGRYVFNPKANAEVHARCFERFIDALRERRANHIVVDNTNVRRFEYANYVRVALLAGVPPANIHEISMHTDPRQLPVRTLMKWAERNVHNVPLDAIEQMAMRWEV